MCNKMILAMRRHGSESYSLLAKQLFVWPYPYNKLSFCHAFPINRYSVEAVLFISHFPSNHIIIGDSDHWLASLHQWLLKF